MSRRHWNKSKLTIEAAQHASIAEGDIVRSYDFPGQRDDSYFEGVVETLEEDRVHIHVTREVWHGEERQVQVARFKMVSPLGVSMHNGAPCVFLIAKRTRKERS